MERYLLSALEAASSDFMPPREPGKTTTPAYAIINEKRPVTVDMAARLSRLW
jgi:hypothetical protein